MKLIIETVPLNPQSISDALKVYNTSFRACAPKDQYKSVLFMNNMGAPKIMARGAILGPSSDLGERLINEGYVDSCGHVFILEDADGLKRLRIYRKDPKNERGKNKKKTSKKKKSVVSDVW